MKSIDDFMNEQYSEIAQKWTAKREKMPFRGKNDFTSEPFAHILLRNHWIKLCLTKTLAENSEQLKKAESNLKEWMSTRAFVRIVGAGRALIAGSLGGNRLAHGGANISFIGGLVPMAHSSKGGGIIACSASGKTPAVLSVLEEARNKNISHTENTNKITIIGIADQQAVDFSKQCHIFIGIHKPDESEYPRPLSALADLEELVIAEILDGLICYAGARLNYTAKDWGMGHEDLGPTGPYDPEKRQV